MKLNLRTILLLLTVFLSTTIHATTLRKERSAHYVYKYNPLCRAIAEIAPINIRPDHYPAALIVNLKKPCIWEDSSEPIPDRRLRIHVTTILLNKYLEAEKIYESDDLDEY